MTRCLNGSILAKFLALVVVVAMLVGDARQAFADPPPTPTTTALDRRLVEQFESYTYQRRRASLNLGLIIGGSVGMVYGAAAIPIGASAKDLELSGDVATGLIVSGVVTALTGVILLSARPGGIHARRRDELARDLQETMQQIEAANPALANRVEYHNARASLRRSNFEIGLGASILAVGTSFFVAAASVNVEDASANDVLAVVGGLFSLEGGALLASGLITRNPGRVRRAEVRLASIAPTVTAESRVAGPGLQLRPPPLSEYDEPTPVTYGGAVELRW